MTRAGSVRWSAVVVAATGVFVALVGLGTLVGAPWRYAGGGAVTMVAQILGALATVGIGAAVAWLGVGDVREKR